MLSQSKEGYFAARKFFPIIMEGQMSNELRSVKMGLALVLLGLAFGVGAGILFGVKEDGLKIYVARGIEAHPEVHDVHSQEIIYRFVERAHFHATGIAAFSLGLIVLVMFSGMKTRLKTVSSVCIGLSSFYPLSWFAMYLLAPSIGRDAAHHHFLPEAFAYIGVGGLLLGTTLLVANLFWGFLGEDARA
jgi:hypothetical protein